MIALLCTGLLPLVLPYLTTYESNPTLLAPARAQAAWVGLWLISMLWVFFQAARFGDDNARSGIGSYFLSAGVSSINQLFQIAAACLSFLVPLLVVAVAVCLLGAMPSDDAQANMWLTLNGQYALLFLVAVSPLVMLAVALGGRFGGTVGYLIPLGLLVFGVYGVGYLEMMSEARDSAFLDWLFVISPHYHLADLTPRLVFKMGSMVSSEFVGNLFYLTGVGLVWGAVAALSFRAKSVN